MSVKRNVSTNSKSVKSVKSANVKAENAKAENVENAESAKAESAKAESAIPEKDIEKELKAQNLSDFKKKILEVVISEKETIKESSISQRGKMYKIDYSLSSDDLKKKRSEIRRSLQKFTNRILGKDRSANERSEALIDFIAFLESTFSFVNSEISSLSVEKITNSEKMKADVFKLLSVLSNSLDGETYKEIYLSAKKEREQKEEKESV